MAYDPLTYNKPTPWEAIGAGLASGVGQGIGSGVSGYLSRKSAAAQQAAALKAKLQQEMMMESLKARAAQISDPRSTVPPENKTEALRVLFGGSPLSQIQNIEPGTTLGAAQKITQPEATLARTSPDEYIKQMLSGGKSGGKVTEEGNINRAAARRGGTGKPTDISVRIGRVIANLRKLQPHSLLGTYGAFTPEQMAAGAKMLADDLHPGKRLTDDEMETWKRSVQSAPRSGVVG